MARGEFYCKEITGFLFLEECYRCKVQFAIPKNLHDVAWSRKEDFCFYCPNGHGQSYLTGETDLDKMRRERDRYAQQVAQKDDEIRAERERRQAAERQVSASKAQVTKMRARAGAGVCQCCNRTFAGLARHMKTKHPNFKAEEVA